MLLGNMRRSQFFLVFLFTVFSNSIAGDNLTPNQSLADGETLVSTAGRYALGFFSPINSKNRYVGIWYNNIPIQTVVWVANRENPVKDSTGSLTMIVNGTLIVRDKSFTVFWSSAETSASNPVARLLDNGNFIVGESNGNDVDGFLWQSFDHLTDTFLPGMKIGSSRVTGQTYNLTSWKHDDDPSPGQYCLGIDVRGDPQLTLWAGSARKYRSGPWNGLRFTGFFPLRSYNIFKFTLIVNKEETFHSYSLVNQSMITRLVVNQSGSMQRFIWIDRTGSWRLFWSISDGQCDNHGVCGPYGICDPNGSPICSCMQSFEPKSAQDWFQMDTSGGCVRKTELDCRNRTDGFVKVSLTGLPDTANATVNMSMSLDECRAVCLSNCSCTGYAVADVNSSGCIVWVSGLVDLQLSMDGGPDLYVRLAAADLGSTSGSTSNRSHKSRKETAVIMVSVVVGLLLIGLIGYSIWRKKKRRRRGTTSFEGARENDLELPLFDLGTVAAVTDNFSVENKLGEGGFGPVYQGKLGEGQEIAVKRLAKTSIQGLDEFKNEVMLIAKLQHRNLVRLLACCIQGEERMLIYEYMPNKSLDLFLFDKAKSAALDWKTRYCIIIGIARGLLYLHQDSRFRIIHRDLKASNVLLDKEMNPKISDFGMARIFGGDETEVNTRRVVGTYGYMSPEYAMDGIFSVKSDVFSFGVLLLEIISGRRNRGVYLYEAHLNLLQHAWNLWKDGKGLELLDESMGYSLSLIEVLRCIKVGLLCVQERPEDRPTMSSVVLMLGSDMSLPHPKQPGFVSTRDHRESGSSSSKQDSCTTNDITTTMIEGR